MRDLTRSASAMGKRTCGCHPQMPAVWYKFLLLCCCYTVPDRDRWISTVSACLTETQDSRAVEDQESVSTNVSCLWRVHTDTKLRLVLNTLSSILTSPHYWYLTLQLLGQFGAGLDYLPVSKKKLPVPGSLAARSVSSITKNNAQPSQTASRGTCGVNLSVRCNFSPFETCEEHSEPLSVLKWIWIQAAPQDEALLTPVVVKESEHRRWVRGGVRGVDEGRAEVEREETISLFLDPAKKYGITR